MAIFTIRGMSVPKRKKVPLEGGRGHTTVYDGVTQFDVELIVDEGQLARMLGPKAVRNKTRRAKLGRGAIICVVKNEKKVPHG